MDLSFKKASLEYKSFVMQWLQEPHVKEFWDNSDEHREDIVIFMEGRKRVSPYCEGMFTYWIGLIDNEPYSMLMTSEIFSHETDLPEVWKANLSKKGRTFSIDFMIGNKKYLGKGLAAPTLEAFTKFIKEHVDASIDTFFIDPTDFNPRAKHVYEKAGFKNVASFTRDCHNQKNVKHYLLIKNMAESRTCNTTPFIC